MNKYLVHLKDSFRLFLLIDGIYIPFRLLSSLKLGTSMDWANILIFTFFGILIYFVLEIANYTKKSTLVYVLLMIPTIFFLAYSKNDSDTWFSTEAISSFFYALNISFLIWYKLNTQFSKSGH